MKIVISIVVFIFFVLSILSFIQTFLIDSTYALSGGTCCPEFGSLCVVDGIVIANYYYLPFGPCQRPQ
jgi:hypothetical protein